jgi:hypothetical protein
MRIISSHVGKCDSDPSHFFTSGEIKYLDIKHKHGIFTKNKIKSSASSEAEILAELNICRF